MQFAPEQQNPNVAFPGRSQSQSSKRAAAPAESNATPSGGPQRHESVSTTTAVDLMAARPSTTSDNQRRVSAADPEILFDQLIDAINFSNSLNETTTNHGWAHLKNQNRNLFYASPSARELGQAGGKRSSGSVRPCSSQQNQQIEAQMQEVPISNTLIEKFGRHRVALPAAAATTSTTSNRHHQQQESPRTRSRHFDVESASDRDVLNCNMASPRFAAISSGIKRKSNAASKAPSADSGKVDKEPKVAGHTSKAAASTDLFLLPSAAGSSSSSLNADANIRMVVCSLSGMIDGSATTSTNSGRFLQVCVLYNCCLFKMYLCVCVLCA